MPLKGKEVMEILKKSAFLSDYCASVHMQWKIEVFSKNISWLMYLGLMALITAFNKNWSVYQSTVQLIALTFECSFCFITDRLFLKISTQNARQGQWQLPTSLWKCTQNKIAALRFNIQRGTLLWPCAFLLREFH